MAVTYSNPTTGQVQVLPDSGLAVLPVGSIIMYASNSVIPNDWLKCEGGAVSRSTYYELFNKIGETYGAGDSSTTFNVPDFRENSPVGIGTNSTHTIAASNPFDLGEHQDDAFQGHWHEAWATPGGGGSNTALTTRTNGGAPAAAVTTYNAVRDIIADGTNGTPRTGTTTHPKQLGVIFIIKARLNSVIVTPESTDNTGIVSFAKNPEFEENLNYWTPSGMTFTAENSSPLVNTQSGKMTLTASVGDTTDCDLDNISDAHKPQSWKVEFYYETDATYVDETLEVYLLCDTAEVLVGTIVDYGEITKFVNYVTPIDTATTYKLRFKSATGVVADSTVTIDSIAVFAQAAIALPDRTLTIVTTEAYTVEDNVRKVMVDTTSSDITITIPASLTIGTEIKIVKISASNKVTIARSSTDVFGVDSITSLEIFEDGDYYFLEKVTSTRWDNQNHSFVSMDTDASSFYDQVPSSGTVDFSSYLPLGATDVAIVMEDVTTGTGYVILQANETGKRASRTVLYNQVSGVTASQYGITSINVPNRTAWLSVNGTHTNTKIAIQGYYK